MIHPNGTVSIRPMRSVDEQFAVLTRGCEHIYSAEELRSRLERSVQASTPLRVKLGMDPTAPDLTLGHTVVLRKLPACLFPI